ncbi:MAG: PTS-dependent dihydroxyacetone kinase phosphotransferase subunit DhaM [Oscillospiraceae bacterium]|nr:PTS-dependent dihydroxyacetone kinase phosphotransferase subunit DhaM [Oscillospiraceae bacterium]
MVGLVIVSHSELIARGVMELCRQMAPNVPMAAAGGLPGGEIGTDFERIYEAIASVGGDDGVAVLFDLGSALMTTEMVVEQFEDYPVRLVNAPIVEGAVLAAVTAEGGATLDEVLAEAKTFYDMPKLED